MIVALVVQRKNAYSFSYSVIINTELKTKSCVGGHLKLQIHRKDLIFKIGPHGKNE
jgi:hypothetical protein